MSSLSRSLSLLALMFAAELAAEDWPQFLGPRRNGISAEQGLLERFPAAGPKEVFRVAGGEGMSGLAILDGRLVTLVQVGGKQVVVCLDAATGERRWETPIAPAYENQMGNGPRATPALADGRAIVFTGEGILVALSLADGKEQWRQSALADLGGKPADYGMACSPLVDGKLVFVTPGAPEATVIACDAATGKLVWKAGRDPAGYSSPAILDLAGTRQLVAFTGASALGLAPDSGQLLWRHPYVTDYQCNIATPLAVDGKLLLSSGENHGSVLLRVSKRGGQFQVAEEWSSQGTQSVLRNEWQTSILHDGHLYGLDNVGSAGPVTHLTCVEAATGRRVWQQPRFGKGNLSYADGKLWLSTIDGELVLVRATPSGYEELGRRPLVGFTRQAPVIAHGKLYLRDNEQIVGVEVAK